MKTLDQLMAIAHQFIWVIFDLDETLIFRAPDIVQQANLAALRILCTKTHDMRFLADHLAHVYQHTAKGNGILVPKRQQLQLLLNRLGRSDNVESLFTAYITAYMSKVEMFPEVQATLSALKINGIRLGIATNSSPDVVEEVLQNYDMLHFFQIVVTPAHVGSVKPSHAYAAFVTEQTGAAPHRIMFVGNHAEDMMTARNMGSTAILVRRGSDKQEEVMPDYIVKTLKEILPIFCDDNAIDGNDPTTT